MIENYVFKKIKAGALQYVLVIAIIIAIVLLTFITLVNIQQRLNLKHDAYKQTITNVNYSFDVLLKSTSKGDNTNTQFAENSNEIYTTQQKKWGIFSLGIIESKIRNEFFKKVGLLGSSEKVRDRKALYLRDNNTSLILVGNSKIVGNVLLPKQGVKTGNIAGTSYYGGNRLIYGSSGTSRSIIPGIANFNDIKTLYNTFSDENSEDFEFVEGKIIVRSFSVPTYTYKASQLDLKSITLEGNIIIRCSKKIRVKQSAILEDVILIAPEIEIDPTVNGNFQVFASKSILVGKDCKLNYPTALVLLNAKEESEDVAIEIDENTLIKGTVLYYKEQEKKISYLPQIKMNSNSKVVGEVYCKGNFELLGTVYGSVYCNNFITNQFGSKYLNHIYNGIINVKQLPEEYVGLPIRSTHKKVVKWLY